MPTYEYECLRCGHTFEKFHGISATPPKRCPKCRSKVKRRIGKGGGLLFKGAGFYTTDYRSEGYKKAAKSEHGDSKPAAGSSDKSKGGSAASKKPSSTS